MRNPNRKNMQKQQLGLDYGTASSRLRKNLLFHLAVKCGMDDCYRCGEKIETPEDMHIDHKEYWFNSDDPAGKFFDLENVAFSHAKCNILDGRGGFHKNPEIGRNANKLGVVRVMSPHGFKGIRYLPNYRGSKKWRALITINGKMKHIGYYATAIEAAMAYDKATIEHRGPDAITNKSLGLL